MLRIPIICRAIYACGCGAIAATPVALEPLQLGGVGQSRDGVDRRAAGRGEGPVEGGRVDRVGNAGPPLDARVAGVRNRRDRAGGEVAAVSLASSARFFVTRTRGRRNTHANVSAAMNPEKFPAADTLRKKRRVELTA
jgi:hypothetical protein